MTELLLYTGTFPRAYHSDPVDVAVGIYTYRVDLATASTTLVGTTPAMRPGWLTIHLSGRFLYAVNEVREIDGRPGGSVTAYLIDPATGQLEEQNERRTGASPCFAAVDPAGSHLVVSTFHGSSLHVFPIETDGSLGTESDSVLLTGSSVHPVRQREPHPHSVVFDPSGRYVIVPDLGTDRVEVFEFDCRAGALTPLPLQGAALQPGSGPRHAVFHPNGRWVFVVNEMDATVTTLSFDGRSGYLGVESTVDVLPSEVAGHRSAAEIVIHPSGRYVYVTHRSHGTSGPRPEGGEDCVAWFEVDGDSGHLESAGRVDSGGAIPRSCVFSPDGSTLLVGHQGSSSIVLFDVNAADGSLHAVDRIIPTPVPVCLLVGGVP